MRILQVDKFLRRQGGAPAYMIELGELQRTHGHTVEFFAMADEENLPATYEDDFAPAMSLKPFPTKPTEQVVTLGNMIWSRRAKQSFERVLDQFQPDVVHLHNIYHQLSPSILRPLASRKIPAVMTVHDPKLVCPSYKLLAGDDVCERCIGKATYWRAPVQRCYEGSFAASAALAVESTIHKWTRAYGPIDIFITPSRYLYDRFDRHGVFPERLRHITHGFDMADFDRAVASADPDDPGEGFVFVGRLTHDKGIHLVIEAMATRQDLTLRVLGDGPAGDDLRRLAAERAPGRVEFVGKVPKEQVIAELAAARASVLTSIWPENQPMSILEAMAMSTPMVVSDIGGSPELVVNDETGIVVPNQDVPALAAALGRLQDDADLARRMGVAGRRRVERDFDTEQHHRAVLRAYSEAALHKGRTLPVADPVERAERHAAG